MKLRDFIKSKTVVGGLLLGLPGLIKSVGGLLNGGEFDAETFSTSLGIVLSAVGVRHAIGKK